MHAAIVALGALNSVTFAGLAIVTAWQWARRRDAAAARLTLSFVTLAIIVTVGRLVPAHHHALGWAFAVRLEIELLVLFPYLLYSFAVAFAPPSRRLQTVVTALTASLSVWTFALPSVPGSGDPRPAWFVAYIVAFLVHWAVLSSVVAVRLWRAGRGQPGVASGRMRMLAFAAVGLVVAIVGSASITNTHSSGELVVQFVATLSGVAFLLGLAPPSALRAHWRTPAQRELELAIRQLMTLATTREEAAERVLPSTVAIVGAHAAQLLDADGSLVASEGVPPEGQEPLRIDATGASLIVWTSPYAPFFGDDELSLLNTLAALIGITLDRVRLFEQERETRLELERNNEVMADFIALAAHELRTPVTAIHGFVQTLNHLGPRLSSEQRHEVRATLEQQTARLALLVEQLLDLSRLDAAAVEVRPRAIDLRSHLEETVAAAAGSWESSGNWKDTVKLTVDAPETTEVDPAVLDRIVTNLVTNAFRYGRPPVRVHAERLDGRLFVAVEDDGPGVMPELEQTLFERFTRAGVAKDRVSGTGLGLAIARAYARAHEGDLRYEGGPTGARFVLELPTR
ncbi:MAG TPA: ATP-binding protein [Gaiellaceae bacterium]